MKSLTVSDVLTSNGKYPDREKSDECTDEVRSNAFDLIQRVNGVLAFLLMDARVSSGFRTQQANGATSGARKSAHLTGEAVDLEDLGQHISGAIMSNRDLLLHYGLYMEDPRYTPTWCHLQSRPTKSGKRVFVP